MSRAIIEVLEVNHRCQADVVLDSHSRNLICTEEVSNVQGCFEVRVINGLNERFDAVAMLNEIPVVLHACCNAAFCRVIRYDTACIGQAGSSSRKCVMDKSLEEPTSWRISLTPSAAAMSTSPLTLSISASYAHHPIPQNWRRWHSWRSQALWKRHGI